MLTFTHWSSRMTWWAWVVLGVVLLGIELFAVDAQFFLVFLGISAAVVGIIGGVGIELSQTMQWAIFGALSLIMLLFFRKNLYKKIHGSVPDYKEGVEGGFVVITEDLEVGKQSRVSFRGTDWTVINDGSTLITGGTRVQISHSEGLTLHVKND